jgi:hypothetical protein
MPLRQPEHPDVKGPEQAGTGHSGANHKSRRREQQDPPVIALHALKGYQSGNAQAPGPKPGAFTSAKPEN